jgi:hypothetical protein
MLSTSLPHYFILLPSSIAHSLITVNGKAVDGIELDKLYKPNNTRIIPKK